MNIRKDGQVEMTVAEYIEYERLKGKVPTQKTATTKSIGRGYGKRKRKENSFSRWTEAEEKVLSFHISNHAPVSRIARELKRSKGAIYNRGVKLGLIGRNKPTNPTVA
jgi:hypothetical protein